MKVTFLVIFTCLYGLTSSFLFSKSDPEVYLNITQAIQYYGYPCEDHSVVTEDGYILSLQRIPRGKRDAETNVSRPVALLQHGLLDSAHTWVFNAPGQGLAFILADKGFDVWLTNSRGSTYSKKHVHISPTSKRFWEFSIDEMAKYDLPANIRYALRISNASTLSYVGHSQGSMMAFAQFSKDQELSSLVSSFVALGPVTTVKHIGLIPSITLKALATFAPIGNFLYHGEFFPTSKLLQFVADAVCTKEILTRVCYDPIFWLSGFDMQNLNTSRLAVIIGHTPAGTSFRNLVHFNQLVKSGNFQSYDYGSASQNQYKYGTPIPPLYDVTKLKVPLAMYWGGKDILASPEDVKNLIPLVYKTLKYHKFIPYYNHMDYIWGVDSNTVIYNEAFDFMMSYVRV